MSTAPVPRVEGTVLIENAHIIFRNFEGKEGQYNAKGQRNFAVLLADQLDLANKLAASGWNIKQLKVEEGEPPRPFIEVSVGFGIRPPRLVVISSAGRVDLCQIDPETGKPREEEAALLDWVDIAKADLIIRPYNWGPIGGRYGVKAYLKSLFIHILEDELELRYRDVPRVQLETRAAPLALPPGSIPVPDTDGFDEADMNLAGAEEEIIYDAELVD